MSKDCCIFYSRVVYRCWVAQRLSICNVLHEVGKEQTMKYNVLVSSVLVLTLMVLPSIAVAGGAIDLALKLKMQAQPDVGRDALHKEAEALGFWCYLINVLQDECRDFLARVQASENLRNLLSDAAQRGVFIWVDRSFGIRPGSIDIDFRASPKQRSENFSSAIRINASIVPNSNICTVQTA